MILIPNSLSYTQAESENLMAKNLQSSEKNLRFISNYGCGELLEDYSTHLIDWEGIKKHPFSEYDGLWKELAKR